MNLTNRSRALTLIVNLLKNPKLAFPYVMHNLVSKKSPVERGLPWWSYRGIQRMDRLASGKRIFEYGTGGSTLRYGKVATKIVAVEDNSDWVDIVKEKLLKNGLDNVEIILAPFDFKNPTGFSSSAYLNALASEYDIIIVDGQDHSFQERITCFRHAENFVSAGGVIVVDDSWRYPDLYKTSMANRVVVEESVGPCRFGVTSTAFFYY